MDELHRFRQPTVKNPSRKPPKKYGNTPLHLERLQDGPDALPVRRLAKPPVTERVDPWTLHAREIAYRLASIENAAAEVHLSATNTPNTRLLTFRLDQVGKLSSAEVWISLLAKSSNLIAHLGRGNAAFDSTLTSPWRLPLRPSPSGQVPAVLVWRCDVTPIEAGFRVVELLRDSLGVTSPERVRTQAVEAEHHVVNTRMNQVRRLEERRLRHTRVLAVCQKCGRDLRDPTYAEIGIGPECVKSYPSAQLRARRQLDRELQQSTHIHLNAKRPEAWLHELNQRWGLTDLVS
jgi:hypothetical protein